MPGIKVVGKGFLDTQGVSFPYTIKTPLRITDSSDGSFVFTTTIPDSDNNRKILGFLGRTEGFHSEQKDADVEIYLKGLHIWDGVLTATLITIDNGSDSGIEVSIGVGRGEFNYLAKDKNISSMMPDEVHEVGTKVQRNNPYDNFPYDYVNITGFNDVVNKKYPEINFAIFPVKIEDFVSSMGTNFLRGTLLFREK